jgi:hypothetical protein
MAGEFIDVLLRNNGGVLLVARAFGLAASLPEGLKEKDQGAGRVWPITLVEKWMRPSPPHVMPPA